jgi:hypothetical protein
MKRYISTLGVWAIAVLFALGVFLLSTFMLPTSYSAAVGVGAGVAVAFTVSAILASTDRKYDPLVEKYAGDKTELTEPVRILSIKGQRVGLKGRIVVTRDSVVMVLLPQNGFKFTLDEDHSFIFVEKEHRLLLAKSDVDIQLTSGAMLNNLSRISTAITSKGFRIEQREHAPY